MTATPRLRIGVDTGGTHTDLVLVDDADGGRLLTLKVPTTPGDLSAGILDATRRALAATGGRAAAEVARFVYGTTLVTNLIVEESAVPVGLIATEGFRDVLEIGRASRKANIYDIHWRPPPPLVPRHLRFGVPERVAHDGSVLVPLDEAAARAALRRLREAGAGSIAVCLLNAYANPVHERRLAALAAEECPGIDVSISSDVVREFREYERSSTTALNAFVRRSLSRHLDGLAAALAAEGVPGRPAIMRGNGGVMSFRAAKALPAAVTHSGPMGGIVGGARLAEACGLKDVVTLDMGGTSADVSLIAGGAPVLTTRGRLGHHPVLLPMLDLVTIGAGGGSIAWTDAGGALRVGPRSAGAQPGPACYGQGGADPTVTDANLVAGRLNPGYFLAGARALQPALAAAALREKLCAPLGLSPEAAAIGVLAIAEAHMVNAIKLISVQRGLDPRDFTLVAFGGAGPLHGIALAEELAIGQVLIPFAPGNLSAVGMLAAEVRHDLVRTRVAELAAVDPATLAADLAELLDAAAALLAEEAVAEPARQYLAGVDLRYRGQNYELHLPLPGAAGAVTPETLGALTERFHAEHRRVYGYELRDRAVQLVNLRLSGIGRVPPFAWPRRDGGGAGQRDVPPAGERAVLLADGQRARAVPVHRAADLAPGRRIAGPAIVEYPGSTLFLPPGWGAEWDAMGNALARRAGG